MTALIWNCTSNWLEQRSVECISRTAKPVRTRWSLPLISWPVKIFLFLPLCVILQKFVCYNWLKWCACIRSRTFRVHGRCPWEGMWGDMDTSVGWITMHKLAALRQCEKSYGSQCPQRAFCWMSFSDMLSCLYSIQRQNLVKIRSVHIFWIILLTKRNEWSV